MWLTHAPPYICEEIRPTKADKDLFSFKVFELWIFENTWKWKRHHDAAWTIRLSASRWLESWQSQRVHSPSMFLLLEYSEKHPGTKCCHLSSSVDIVMQPHFFPHPLFAMPYVFWAAGSHASSAWSSPSPGGSFLTGCVGGQISFIHRCVGCYLSNPIWCDLCRVSGPTFHNKFFLNSSVFRLVSHLQGGLWLITWRIASLWLAG